MYRSHYQAQGGPATHMHKQNDRPHASSLLEYAAIEKQTHAGDIIAQTSGLMQQHGPFA